MKRLRNIELIRLILGRYEKYLCLQKDLEGTVKRKRLDEIYLV